MRLKYRLPTGQVVGYQKVADDAPIPQVKEVVSTLGHNWMVLAVAVRAPDLIQLIVIEQARSVLARLFGRR